MERTQLPIPDPPFTGTIGETYKDSTPAWPAPVVPPDGAPNVVVILLDDVGFGQTSVFGGPVPTPNLEKFGDQALKYNRFHTTAICGPSRAALLTGRNHHNCGSGFLMEWATGFPSYDTIIPQSTATVGRILRDNGYTTAWFGKNHNTPDWEQTVVGPFDRWPTGMGFDYFYGFNAGETNQFYPVLFENTRPVEANKLPEEGYHLDIDLADRATTWLNEITAIAPDKPFFMYYAPGSAHAPHHTLKEWRDKFKGAFDDGWDQVRADTYQRQLDMGIIPEGTQNTPRPDWVPEWDSLDDDHKKLYARFMENYCAFLHHSDEQLGRVLDTVKSLPNADNTLIFVMIGDNGASSEGGHDGTINEIANFSGDAVPFDQQMAMIDHIGDPNTEPHYPVGWAWCGNAPFQWVKQVASHFGGSRNPMMVQWPKRIKPDGKMRPQFTHLIDIVPTILDAAGIEPPKMVNGIEQKPMDGVSIASTWEGPDTHPVRERQYFEVLSNRAIYDNGWIACAQHTKPWEQDVAPGNWDKDHWELYNLNEDYSENNDLSAQFPEKVEELKKIFDEECQKYGVYPLDDRGGGRLAVPKPTPPGSDPDRRKFVYKPGATRISESVAPNTHNRDYLITAYVTEPGDGTLLSIGGSSAGLMLYVQDGYPVFYYNYLDITRTEIKGSKKLPDGASTIQVVFKYDGGGIAKGGNVELVLNDESVATGRLEKTVRARFGLDTFGVGVSTGAPVADTFTPPFKFEGKFDRIEIELGDSGMSPEQERIEHARWDANVNY